MPSQTDVLVISSSRLDDVLTARDVDEYLQAQPGSTPFDSWAWLAAADGALDDHQKAIAVCKTLDGELLGWLALRVDRDSILGLKIPVLRFLTDPRADRHSVQFPADQANLVSELVDAVKGHTGHWSAVLLDEVSQSEVYAAQPSNWSTAFKRQTPVYNFPEVDAGQDPVRELVGKRGRRARKKLDKLEPEFRVWRPSEHELDELLRNIRGVENASWKGDKGVGIFGSTSGFEFFKAVASQAALAGSLMVATVHIEGKLASYRFGFVWKDIFYDYNFAYLPEYSNLSLGRVLLDELIVRGYEAGLRGIDGSRVGSSYENLLRERSDASIEHRRWMYFRWTPGGILLGLKYLVLKPLKRTLKKLVKRNR